MKNRNIKFTMSNHSMIGGLLGKVFFVTAFVLCSHITIGQVAINEDNSAPAAIVELDIKSTTKGVLFPQLTESQRDLIPSPATGLMIFNRSGGYFNIYDGTNWQQMARAVSLSPSINPTVRDQSSVGVGVGVSEPDSSAILHVNDTLKGFLLPRTASTPSATAGMLYYSTFSNAMVYHNGTEWLSPALIASTAGAGGAGTTDGFLIGGGTIDGSAKMEVITVDGLGMFLPRMTTAQRDLIDSPLEGLILYNSDDNEFQYYAASAWYKIATSIPALGTVATNPGQSCKDIFANNPLSVGVDGTYWIDPDGVGGNAAVECVCDMSRYGGGWTLVVNTGFKGTNNEDPTQVGTFPIQTTAMSPAAKFSDTDINLIRGTLSTSLIFFEAPYGNGTEGDIFFRENTAYKANASSDAESIKTYTTIYNDALLGLGLTVNNARNNAGALHNWDAPNNYGIIMSYGAEELITDAGNNDCGGLGATFNNRRLCNALVWVKQP
jgi:hypothetical protein